MPHFESNNNLLIIFSISFDDEKDVEEFRQMFAAEGNNVEIEVTPQRIYKYREDGTGYWDNDD